MSRPSRSPFPVQPVPTTPLNPTIRTMANIDEIVSSLVVVSNDCSGADRKSQSLDKGLGGHRPDTEHGIQLIRYLHKSQVV